MSGAQQGRIQRRFAKLRDEKRAGLITYFMAGDPDGATFETLLAELPAAGADLIEVGMPFSDPMADGPSIQEAGFRSLRAGTKLRLVLGMVQRFREHDQDTPIILMGYFNPIHRYGVDRFVVDAKEAGIDALIIVDLPPEEDDELCLQANRVGLDFIHLAAPTTTDDRLEAVLEHGTGFVYYVAITGVTGTRSAASGDISAAVARLKAKTDLPIAVGFGVKTPEQARDIARSADAVVVGSSLVNELARHLDTAGKADTALIPSVLALVRDLAAGIRGAR
jgi:tryptophan synthase alpha chain